MKNPDAKVALKLKGRTIPDKLTLWGGVAKAAPDVKVLATVTPSVAEVNALAGELAEANKQVDDAKNVVTNLILRRDKAETAFDAGFITLSTSAQALCSGDAVLLSQAALPLASQNTTPIVLTKVDGLSATQGAEKGQVEMSWNSVKRAKSYVVRFGLGGGPDKLPETRVVTKSRLSLRGLASGQEGWAAVYAVGAEDGPASDPVRFMVP